MKLTLVRGLPGAGKSTFAGSEAIEADWWFCQGVSSYKLGEYEFDPSELKNAHAWCQQRTREQLESGLDATVANTFTQRWEMQSYIDMAKELGAELVVHDVYDGEQTDEVLAERNVHGVPLEAIQRMRARYEKDWENGNPMPPWAR
ncbi:MAG: ATP-binding protein [Candidatus Peribacter sp.]|nr:ATP-binding protein [Candidatus Peribacter sp.]MBT7537884.1 ATP-binding protein [Gammaproteobacteria bacterium]